VNCCIARIIFLCCKRESITQIETDFDEVTLELLCFIEVDELFDGRHIWFWFRFELSECQSGGVVLTKVNLMIKEPTTNFSYTTINLIKDM